MNPTNFLGYFTINELRYLVIILTTLLFSVISLFGAFLKYYRDLKISLDEYKNELLEKIEVLSAAIDQMNDYLSRVENRISMMEFSNSIFHILSRERKIDS